MAEFKPLLDLGSLGMAVWLTVWIVRQLLAMAREERGRFAKELAYERTECEKRHHEVVAEVKALVANIALLSDAIKTMTAPPR